MRTRDHLGWPGEDGASGAPSKEARYGSIFRNAPCGMALFDLEGRFVEANRLFARMVGCGDPAVFTRGFRDLAHPEDREAFAGASARLLSGGEQTLDFRGRILREDGGELRVAACVSVLEGDGGPEELLLGLKDETERWEAENRLRQGEERFRVLVDQSSEIVKLVNLDGTLRYASPAFTRVLGYRVEDVLGTNVFDLVNREDIADIVEATERAVHEERTTGETVWNVAEYRMRHADGTWRYLESIGTYLLEHPAVKGVIINARDVTERKANEEKLRRSEETHRRVIETVGEVIFRVDDGGCWSFLNPAWTRITGFPVEETIGKPAGDFMRYVPTEPSAEVRDSNIVEVEIDTRRGPRHVFEISFAERPKGGRFAGSFGILHDVTERKRLEDRLQRLAMYDPLTDLPNRRMFMKLLNGLKDRTEGEAPVSVLFVDLDNFKSVNDTLGHDAGDTALTAVAGRLRGCTRAEDTVVRLGGEEFVVLMVGAGREEAESTARRILDVFERPFSVDPEGHQTNLAASVGIAVSEALPPKPDRLLGLADKAMYRVKARGGNGFEFWR